MPTTQEHCKVLSKDIIKYAAMLTMLLNHIAVIFLKSDTLLCEIFTAAGYYTAIVMIYFLVEGYYYTRSKKKYILRLFVFALISEIPYCLAFSKNAIIDFYGLNMLFTLCICFGVIWAVDNIKSKALKVLLIISAILLSSICDWPILAPVFTLLFVWSKKDHRRNKIALSISVLLLVIFLFLCGIGSLSVGKNLLYSVLSIIGSGAAAFSILYLYNGKRSEKGRTFSKWFFYIFYPAHLLALGIIRIAIFYKPSILGL